MNDSAGRWSRIAEVVGAPDFVVPWLDRFYEPAEVDLVLALADGPRTERTWRTRLPCLRGTWPRHWRAPTAAASWI